MPFNKYFGSVGLNGIYHNYSTLQCESSQRQHLHGEAWLRSNKSLFADTEICTFNNFHMIKNITNFFQSCKNHTSLGNHTKPSGRLDLVLGSQFVTYCYRASVRLKHQLFISLITIYYLSEKTNKIQNYRCSMSTIQVYKEVVPTCQLL